MLSDLADKLKDIVVDMAVEAAVAELRSRQSSPTGSIPPEESMDQSYVDDFL